MCLTALNSKVSTFDILKKPLWFKLLKMYSLTLYRQYRNNTVSMHSATGMGHIIFTATEHMFKKIVFNLDNDERLLGLKIIFESISNSGFV
jgi:hypothetical protein